MWGTDQAASLSEEGMRQLSTTLKKLPSILGDGVKKITKEEKKIFPKFKYWK